VEAVAARHRARRLGLHLVLLLATAGCGPLASVEFVHGVASGDPTADSVILWTRATPVDEGTRTPRQPRAVHWLVATDPQLHNTVAQGEYTPDASRDYTVKVDVTGLQPGTTYYYRFDETEIAGNHSPIGRTRTLPRADAQRLRLAVVACTAHAAGYFNSYAHIAQRADLDAVVHLGDYIYEYGHTRFDIPFGRTPQPLHDAVSLDDYRQRYAQYRSDPDLQQAHRQHPFIAMWDDHEFADNFWNGGARNHRSRDGSFAARRLVAGRAYAEWMPIRESRTTRGIPSLYRSLSFGTLLDLVLLDARIEDRDEASPETRDDPSTSPIGETQERWLMNELSDSQARGTRWRFMMSQIIFGQIEVPDFPMHVVLWEGYPRVRTRILDHLVDEDIGDVVVVSSDLHAAAAIELARDPFSPDYDPESGEGVIAAELVANSMTAPHAQDFVDADGPAVVAATHPHFKYLDTENRGYLLIDVDAERVQGEWYASETIRRRRVEHHLDRAFRIRAGDPRLEPVEAASAPRAEGPPLAP